MTTQRPGNRERQGECAQTNEWVAHLYETYAPRIAAYALRRTNRADSADVVAETFLVAWRRREVIPSEPMTLPWLYGVARRVLANQHRTHHRRSRLHDRLNAQFIQHQEPCARVDMAEDFEQVAAALKRLSADDAEVLRLTAWESLSPTEIAAVMGIGSAAVRQRLHRARKRLRKQLSVDGRDRNPQSKSQSRTLRRPTPTMRPARAAFVWELSDEGR